MIQTINEWAFIDAFRKMRPDTFSEAALSALYEWYAEYEDDTDEQVKLDVISICCDWTEYSAAELIAEYGEDEDEDDHAETLAKRMQDQTTVISVDGGRYLVMAH